MSKWKKWIAFLLATVCSVSVLAGCKGCKDEETNTPHTASVIGVHDYTAPIREGEYIVQNGSSNYKILLAEDASTYCKNGAKELIQFFAEATGIQLPMVQESGEGFTHSAGQRYISIGNTKLWQSIGEKQLEVDTRGDAIRIITKDTNIYISSLFDENNLFGVYDFLQILLNYEYYAKDCWEIDTNVKTLPLRDFNVVDIPDFSRRSDSFGYVRASDDPMASSRFRYNQTSVSIPIGDLECPDVTARTSIHNTSELLPRTAETNDPKWQADGNQQLCYTAHGDAESYDKMTSRAAYVIEQSLIDYPRELYPNYRYSTICVEDFNNSCTCDACAEATALYGGAKAGAPIKFTNDVMAKIKAWMELPENEPYKRDDYYLLFSPYFAYVAAPAHYDEAAGKYVANHPDVQPREDVGIYYIMTGASYITSMYDKRNEKNLEQTKAWQDLTPNFSYYLYENNFHNEIGFWDTFSHYDTEGYQLYRRAENVMNFYAQASGVSTGVTAFQGLKIYLASKLLWDCSLDQEALMEKWFNAMYGKAAPIMKELFDDERYYSNSVYEKKGTHSGHGFGVAYVKSDWSMAALNRWIGLLEEAYEVTEQVYKTAMPEKYAMIKHHIDYEYVFPGSYVVDIFTRDTYGEKYIEIVKYLQEINSEIGEWRFKEHDTLGSFNKIWMDINVGE